jgi:hypothetical protein
MNKLPKLPALKLTTLFVSQVVNRSSREFKSHNPIINRRGSSPLNVPQNRKARIHAQRVSHASPLGHNPKDVFISRHPLLTKSFPDRLEIIFNLRNKAHFGTSGQRTRHREISAITSHRFDDEGSRKGRCRGPNTVHARSNHIESDIHSEAVISAGTMVAAIPAKGTSKST